MNKKFYKIPTIFSYTAEEIIETIGPVQSASVTPTPPTPLSQINVEVWRGAVSKLNIEKLIRYKKAENIIQQKIQTKEDIC